MIRTPYKVSQFLYQDLESSMPKIAIFQFYQYGCCEDSPTIFNNQIDTWTEVTKEELLMLKHYIVDRNRRIYDKPLMLVEQVPETTSKEELSIEGLLESAKELEAQKQAEIQALKLKQAKAEETRKANALEKKRKKLEQLKAELGE